MSFLFLSFFFFFFFLGHPYTIWRFPVKGSNWSYSCWPMQQTETWDLRCVCNLHYSSRQCWILNPLREAKDRTRVLMDTGQIHFHWFIVGTPVVCLLKFQNVVWLSGWYLIDLICFQPSLWNVKLSTKWTAFIFLFIRSNVVYSTGIKLFYSEAFSQGQNNHLGFCHWKIARAG